MKGFLSLTLFSSDQDERFFFVETVCLTFESYKLFLTVFLFPVPLFELPVIDVEELFLFYQKCP